MRTQTFAVAALGFALALSAQAGLENVSYPVAELGGCADQDSCRDYCSAPSNFDACMAYASANNLLEEEEIQEYQQMQELVAQGGPGGCTSEEQCETYCGDLNNMSECLAFAQEHGLMDERELEDARKVQAALDAGYSMPGGCTSEDSCKAYCEQPGNMEECLSFASAAGFMSPEEIEEARQVMTIMQSGNSPGGCQNQQECEAYCEDEAHREECTAFAVEAGFMTADEAQQMREMGSKGEMGIVGPGGCTDEEICRAYCELEENREECGAFFGDRGEDMGERDEMMGREFEGDFGGEFDEPEFEFDEAQQRDWHQEDGRNEDLWLEYKDEYQLEGAPRYDIYDEQAPDRQEFDDSGAFDSFDPGDDFQGFDRGDQEMPYDDIYIEQGTDSPSSPDDGTDASDGEHSLAPGLDAMLVESVKQFLRELVGRVN